MVLRLYRQAIPMEGSCSISIYSGKVVIVTLILTSAVEFLRMYSICFLWFWRFLINYQCGLIGYLVQVIWNMNQKTEMCFFVHVGHDLWFLTKPDEMTFSCHLYIYSRGLFGVRYMLTGMRSEAFLPSERRKKARSRFCNASGYAVLFCSFH